MVTGIAILRCHNFNFFILPPVKDAMSLIMILSHEAMTKTAALLSGLFFHDLFLQPLIYRFQRDYIVCQPQPAARYLISVSN